MGILREINEPAAPLMQGDLLKEIPLHATDSSYQAASDQLDLFCLVLSRPCVARHKSWVVVAPVRFFSGAQSLDGKTFDEAEIYFERLRDGVDTPDRFYLGNIPEKRERYIAHLDRLTNVQVPEGEHRQEWIKRHRIAGMDSDFVRSIPARLFYAFGRPGYEDHEWMPSVDRELLVTIGTQELSTMKGELAAIDRKIGTLEFQGGGQEQKRKGMEKERAAAAKRVDDLEGRLAAYTGGKPCPGDKSSGG